jgi:hypothetical protein
MDPAKMIRETIMGKTPAQLNAVGLYCRCRACRTDRAADRDFIPALTTPGGKFVKMSKPTTTRINL